MVRPASYDKYGIKRGVWSEEEDNKLRDCIQRYGHPSNWRLLPFIAGLKRCGKSCRLRWVNYLKPGLRHGNFTKDEEYLIIQLHKQLGNKWSAIAAYFDGRTDNDIKNYWHAHIEKRRNRAMKNENDHLPKQEQSFDTNSCITSGLINQEDKPNSEVVGLSFPAENIGVFESNADSAYINNAGDHHLYQNSEQEFDGAGLWQDDVMSKLFDSSDCGIASWNLMSTAAEPHADFLKEPVGEDFFNF